MVWGSIYWAETLTSGSRGTATGRLLNYQNQNTLETGETNTNKYRYYLYRNNLGSGDWDCTPVKMTHAGIDEALYGVKILIKKRPFLDIPGAAVTPVLRVEQDIVESQSAFNPFVTSFGSGGVGCTVNWNDGLDGDGQHLLVLCYNDVVKVFYPNEGQGRMQPMAFNFLIAGKRGS